MVREIAPRMADEFESRYSSLQQKQVALMIHGVNGDHRPRVAAYEDVMNGAREIPSNGLGMQQTSQRSSTTMCAELRRLCAFPAA